MTRIYLALVEGSIEQAEESVRLAPRDPHAAASSAYLMGWEDACRMWALNPGAANEIATELLEQNNAAAFRDGQVAWLNQLVQEMHR